MDFSFTDEQQAIRETTARFAAERLAPNYLAGDAATGLDRALVREMGALGLIGAELDLEHGGAGLDSVTAGIIVEEIARADLNMAYVQLLNGLVGWIVGHHGRPEIARRVIGGFASGEALGALALTEPGGGSDAASLGLRARRSNDGYVLSGEKTSISMAAQADWIIVFARTGTPEDRARGISAFLLPGESEGLSRTRFDDLGSQSVGRGSLFFDEVRVPDEMRIGEEGEGFRQVMQGFDYSRALIGLQCLAPAAASLAESWTYAAERRTFGRPIAAWQGVSFPLAEAETMIEACRLLCYKTLWLRDQGLPHTAEAAMCKWWAPKLACDIIHTCLLTHGHLGYSRDLPHQKRMRDVLGLQIGDGTAQVQKLVVARERGGRVTLGRDRLEGGDARRG